MIALAVYAAGVIIDCLLVPPNWLRVGAAVFGEALYAVGKVIFDFNEIAPLTDTVPPKVFVPEALVNPTHDNAPVMVDPLNFTYFKSFPTTV